MNKTIATLSIIALLGFAVGCGGGEENTDTLGTAEASLALDSTVAALDSVDVAVESATVDGDRVTATASCTAGGSATVDGVFDGETSLSVSVDFNGCSEEGVTINGSLDYDSSFTETKITLDMNGILEFSGQVVGRCLIDFAMEIGNDLSITMSGTVCGQDVSVLIEQGQ